MFKNKKLNSFHQSLNKFDEKINKIESNLKNASDLINEGIYIYISLSYLIFV